MNQIRSFFSFKTVYPQNKTFLVFSIGRKVSTPAIIMRDITITAAFIL